MIYNSTYYVEAPHTRCRDLPTVPLSFAKTHFAKLITDVVELGERVLITKSGKPAGMLLSVDEYEGLLETLEILADPELAAAVRAGLAEAERGELVEHDEVWRDVDAAVHE